MHPRFLLASLPAARSAVLLSAWLACGLLPAAAVAQQDPEVSSFDVQDARRCAAAVRSAAASFGDVREAVHAGDEDAASAHLAATRSALAAARTTCRGNADVLGQLEILSREAESLRLALHEAR